MEVIDIGDRNKKKKRTDLLEVLDDLRLRIEEGHIEEFVIASMDSDSEVEIHVCSKDFLGAVGLFEIGKNTLIQQQNVDFE